MRILIYGAGAIGSYMGHLLAQAGEDVTLLARGRQAEALKRNGIQVQWQDGPSVTTRVQACEPGKYEGRFDLVIVTLKSMQLAAAAQDMMRALSDDGVLVMVQNGLPWWYFERMDSPWRGTRLDCLDPEGVLARTIALDRVLGAVIYKPVMLPAPGQLFLPKIDSNKLIIGEMDGRISARANRAAEVITRAGMPVEVTPDIRAAKWGKLGVNLIWNPLCSVTQSSPGYIAEQPGATELVRCIVAEAKAAAAAVGVTLDMDAEVQLARAAGNYKQQPSMLQDLRAGRPLEIDAMVNAVIEIARVAKVEVPTLAGLAVALGLLDQRVRSEKAAIGPHHPNRGD